MKTGIKEVSSKYFIDEQKGVVVCLIGGYTSFLSDDLCQPFEVKGIARCHKEDKFDETRGCRLAESRAKYKMFKLAESRARHLKKQLSNLASEVDAKINSNITCQNKEAKHLEELNK